MYICVLSSLSEDPNDKPYDPSPHMNGFKWKHHPVQPFNVEKQLRDLVNEGVDVFVNLCDGTPDDALSGIGLVQLMEKMGLAFTGADSKFFDPSRREMKASAKKAGVPSPNWAMVDCVEDVERAAKKLRYPVLVKPPHGYASVGITRKSRCENLEQLKEQAAVEIEQFGRALLEEFIEGREFTCLIAENPDDPKNPITFKPVEFIFPEGESFKHYDMKWVEYEKMSVAPVDDPRIEKVLREQTARLFKAMNGNGYARCDYRMGADGTIYMLEINPNCGIFYAPHEPGSADFSLLNDPVYNHHKFLNLIIRAAINRQTRMLAAKMKKKQVRKQPAEQQMVYA
ncbi:MAG: D-alanine--D-alanine ligase family protein [Chloroflexota bacterium]|nr:ATP-grasp domain-containing protein [Chloroflexota bacterium]MBI5702439.1 ATP-grasp domain-containing protein [Chloroflexota bacterium]